MAFGETMKPIGPVSSERKNGSGPVRVNTTVVGFRGFDRLDAADRHHARAVRGRVLQPLEVRDDGRGVEWGAVLEHHVVAQGQRVGRQVVADVPLGGERRRVIARLVTSDQRVVDGKGGGDLGEPGDAAGGVEGDDGLLHPDGDRAAESRIALEDRLVEAERRLGRPVAVVGRARPTGGFRLVVAPTRGDDQGEDQERSERPERTSRDHGTPGVGSAPVRSVPIRSRAWRRSLSNLSGSVYATVRNRVDSAPA